MIVVDFCRCCNPALIVGLILKEDHSLESGNDVKDWPDKSSNCLVPKIKIKKLRFCKNRFQNFYFLLKICLSHFLNAALTKLRNSNSLNILSRQFKFDLFCIHFIKIDRTLKNRKAKFNYRLMIFLFKQRLKARFRRYLFLLLSRLTF